MTIARDRWQQHLKSAGSHYREAALALADVPDACGGPVAALALHCLGSVLEACRVGRLTRNQHILLRLGELIAYAECAGALARRAAAATADALPDKADRRFEPAALAAVSRVFAREAAMKVSEEGLRWVLAALPAGPGGAANADSPAGARELAAALPLDRVRAAQSGLLADMDHIADALYVRSPKSSTVEGPS
jgi:alkylation response protein AidB-like acyl-CoA dehydrogenase